MAKKAPRDWQCNECGRKMSLKSAERAMYSVQGCPKCGGQDIDMAVSRTAITADFPPVRR